MDYGNFDNFFGQQHQLTFENNMHIQLSLSLHFYLLYLLLYSCDGNDVKQRVFLGRLLVSEKSRLCSVLALKQLVQSDVILPSCLQVTAFCIDQLLCR